MERVTLDLQFVTPAFLGGADRARAAEWRAASVQGQLRWWLRAMAGPGVALDSLRTFESALFGSTSRSSPLQVRALGSPRATAAGEGCPWGRPQNEQELANAWKDPSIATLNRLRLGAGASNPIHYLGYGPIAKNPNGPGLVVTHGYIPSEEKVTLELQWRRGLDPKALGLLNRALWGWLNLGGIGARSRRGFGSARCTDVKGEGLGTLGSLAPAGRSAFKKQAENVLPSADPQGDLPEWSRLSGRTKIYLGREGARNWEEALTQMGAWLIAFRRRYGSAFHSHPAIGASNPARDYDWAAPRGNARGEGIPERSGFGLPLPFGQGGETVTWGDSEGDGRRASPLLLHVARFDKDPVRPFVPVLTYMPARLIPDGEKLFLKGRPSSGASPGPGPSAIVGRFLEDLRTKDCISEVKP